MNREPIKTDEEESPWLWLLYAVAVVGSIAASSVWPYWITP